MNMWVGISSSLFDRVKDRSYDAWKDDMMWMFFYFTGGVWFCIYLAMAPRIIVKKLKVKGAERESSKHRRRSVSSKKDK